MVVAKRQGREKPTNRSKEGLRTGGRTSGRTNRTPGWPNLHRAVQGEEKTYKKRSQRAGASSLSPLLSVFFTSFGSACPHASRMYFPLFSK